ncbi:polysaccharide deacetylase family protein [Lewinellaceae bacterium SD302]|nr:polysaccharide deacetylase family protein [Lewinellaceae bacterium SD302]
MYLVKTPKIIQKMFPNFHWKVETDQPTIYLTFDDGPIPGVTPWVLEQLSYHEAKATFFCVGSNVQRHPNLLRQVQAAGHTVGNHTMTHKDGWLTDNLPYFHDIRHAGELVDSSLFRPPYGRMKPRQAQFLQRHYNVVMWDVLSGDFDPKLRPEDCYQNVIRNAGPGSIVVFHDSIKARENLEYALPRVLTYFAERGYSFGALTPDLLHNTRSLPTPALRTA